jgi:small-conductance mechanosensitive channel
MEYSNWVAAWNDALTVAVQKVSSHLPNLLSAVALLLGGWLVARLLRGWTIRLIGASLDGLLRSSAARSTLERTGVRRSVPQVVGAATFWTIIVLTVAAVVEVLGLPAVTNLVGRLAYYIPQVVAAVLIVFVGYLLGNLAFGAVSTAAASLHVAYASALGRAAQLAILLVAIVIAIGQVGIDSTFLIVMLTIILATTLGGAALAFGLGCRTAVSNIIAAHYLTKAYRIGQKVRIAGMEGRIVEIAPISVVLQTADGRVYVPAKKFSEETSILLTGEA